MQYKYNFYIHINKAFYFIDIEKNSIWISVWVFYGCESCFFYRFVWVLRIYSIDCSKYKLVSIFALLKLDYYWYSVLFPMPLQLKITFPPKNTNKADVKKMKKMFRVEKSSKYEKDKLACMQLKKPKKSRKNCCSCKNGHITAFSAWNAVESVFGNFFLLIISNILTIIIIM